MKLCPTCLDKLRKAAARGGRNGCHADKVRASLAAAEARAEKAKKITRGGITLSISEWAEETGIPKATIWARLRAHLPVERVLKTKTTSQPKTTKTP